MRHSQHAVAVGIDLGGTDIKSGLVAADGSVLFRASIPTESHGGPQHVIARMIDLVQSLRAQAERMGHEAVAVGVGAPGSIRAHRGVVISPPNLPGWVEEPVVAPISDATGLPVTLDNDANCAMLGEHWLGAGRGTTDMAMLTLGTGIGGGLILNNGIWRGRYENAGELGHTIVELHGRPCKCGQRGCLESYASASSTAERAAERVAAGEASVLTEVMRANGRLTSRDVVAAARSGDALATEVWSDTCRYLAMACVTLTHTLNLERIILAGGMCAAGDDLLGGVRRHFAELMWPSLGDWPEIVLAELANDAGFIGSAYLAIECVARSVSGR